MFNNKPVFGMIHLHPRPATRDAVTTALDEIYILCEEGFNGCIIENYHGGIDDVILTLKAIEKEYFSDFKIGINILPNNFELAFNLVAKYKIDFVQLDYVAGSYSKQTVPEELYLKLKNTTVLGGVWPKYYTPDIGSILEEDLKVAKTRAEAIVVTGAGTGIETSYDKIYNFKRLLGDHPLIVGAGLNVENVKEQLTLADGGIVGSSLKPYNLTSKKIDKQLVKDFISERNKLFKNG